MANRMKNLASMFSDGRTRTIAIFTLVLLVVGIVFGVVKLRHRGGVLGNVAGTTVAAAPGNIQSIPGGFGGQAESAQYARLQAEQNAQEAKKASQSGGSAIPTLISSSSLGNQGFAQNNAGKGGGISTAGCVAQGANLYSSNCQPIATLGADGVVRGLGEAAGESADGGIVQPGRLVYGPDGKVLGTVGADGLVRNAAGQVIGRVGPDGTVIGSNGQVIGRVAQVASGAPVYNSEGQLIGHIAPNGEVVNAQGQVVGRVMPNGEVVNAQGQIIGKAPSFVPNRIAYGPDGKPLGIVNSRGQIVNAQGQVVGEVGPNGEVLNSQGKVIGSVSDVKPGALVYGPDGKLLGRVNADGQVVNAQGQVVGTVGPDGEVRNSQGQIIGKASDMAPGDPVYGPNGQLLGRVNANGQVVNAQGQVVGTVRPDGVVVGPNGQVIGSVGGRPSRQLRVGTRLFDAYGNPIGSIGPGGKFVPIAYARSGVAGAGPASVQGTGGAQATSLNGVTLPGGNAASSSGSNEAIQAMLARQQQQMASAEMQQVRQQMQGAMTGQASQLISAWAPPTQQYVSGNANDKLANAANAAAGSLGNTQGQFAVGENLKQGETIKAGAIMFAVLDVSINTDEPGPIMATITSGGLKGGKLLGTLTNQGEHVMINFNTLSYAGFPSSISLNAVAIDPATARTGLSDYTNNHYLLRYGTMFAATFMQGYAQAISQSGSTIVSNGFNTQKNLPTLSPTGQLVVALGNVGTQYAATLSGIQNTPPTVHVYAGTGLGVLLLSDLKLPQETAVA